MAVKYLSGNRLWGTNAERLAMESTSVKFDAQGVSDDPSGTGQTLDADLTIGDNDDRLLVATAGSYALSSTVTGITWTPSGGSAENLRGGTGDLSEINSGGDGQSQLFYLNNPTIGAGVLEATWTSATTSRRRRVGGMVFYNVDTSGDDTGIGVTTKDRGNSTTSGGDITPTTAGSAIVDGSMWEEGDGNVVQNRTLGWGSSLSAINLIAGDRLQSSQYDLSPTINSANTMEYTGGQSSSWQWVSAEIICETDSASTVNLPNGTIFITSDTNVHYMWNGTDTWNEVA